MTSPTTFRPTLLPLEDRSVPAGNVTARVVGGTLFVDGDAAANSFVVAGTGWRSVAVRPGDADTTINGLPNGQGVFLGDITRGIVVRAGDGEDTVRMEGVKNRHYIGVFAGAGEDEVVFERVEARGTVEIVDDVVPIPPEVAADTDDVVRLSNSQFRKSVSVRMQGGDDQLSVANSTIRGQATFEGGIGVDTYSRVNTSSTRTITFGRFETVLTTPIPPPVPPVVPPPSAEPPSATLSTTAGESTPLAAIPFTTTFSDAVSDFTLDDVGVTNGIPSNFIAISDTEYRFTVTPNGDGEVTVSVPADAATDRLGRGNTAADPLAVQSIRSDAGMDDTLPDVNDPNFVPTGSGLATWDILVGSGTAVTSETSEVQVFYTGFLTDGTVFDSARTLGQPATFDPDGLIAGFREGLIGMQPGGIRRFRIPPELGYGAAGTGNIPPNATLIFEVKMVKVS
jgi:FKBP-type peptidyl-prolyl cis-trans isomerase FkpA